MRQSPSARRRQLRLEALEDRSLLSATSFVPPENLIANTGKIALINETAPAGAEDAGLVKEDVPAQDTGEEVTDAPVCDRTIFWANPDETSDGEVPPDGIMYTCFMIPDGAEEVSVDDTWPVKDGGDVVDVGSDDPIIPIRYSILTLGGDTAEDGSGGAVTPNIFFPLNGTTTDDVEAPPEVHQYDFPGAVGFPVEAGADVTTVTTTAVDTPADPDVVLMTTTVVTPAETPSAPEQALPTSPDDGRSLAIALDNLQGGTGLTDTPHTAAPETVQLAPPAQSSTAQNASGASDDKLETPAADHSHAPENQDLSGGLVVAVDQPI